MRQRERERENERESKREGTAGRAAFDSCCLSGRARQTGEMAGLHHLHTVTAKVQPLAPQSNKAVTNCQAVFRLIR